MISLGSTPKYPVTSATSSSSNECSDVDGDAVPRWIVASTAFPTVLTSPSSWTAVSFLFSALPPGLDAWDWGAWAVRSIVG